MNVLVFLWCFSKPVLKKWSWNQQKMTAFTGFGGSEHRIMFLCRRRIKAAPKSGKLHTSCGFCTRNKVHNDCWLTKTSSLTQTHGILNWSVWAKEQRRFILEVQVAWLGSAGWLHMGSIIHRITCLRRVYMRRAREQRERERERRERERREKRGVWVSCINFTSQKRSPERSSTGGSNPLPAVAILYRRFDAQQSVQAILVIILWSSQQHHNDIHFSQLWKHYIFFFFFFFYSSLDSSHTL